MPSRFVNFPDEGHWVLKPRNSRFWHEEVRFAWLKKHAPPGTIDKLQASQSSQDVLGGRRL